MWKLFLCMKFPLQEVRWKYGIICSAWQGNSNYNAKKICVFLCVFQIGVSVMSPTLTQRLTLFWIVESIYVDTILCKFEFHCMFAILYDKSLNFYMHWRKWKVLANQHYSKTRNFNFLRKIKCFQTKQRFLNNSSRSSVCYYYRQVSSSSRS